MNSISSLGWPKLYEIPPAYRILAWCLHVGAVYPQSFDAKKLAPILAPRYVDQVGFPFQLNESSAKAGHVNGFAFSWAGNPRDLEAVAEAVKLGHSVNWSDLGARGILCGSG